MREIPFQEAYRGAVQRGVRYLSLKRGRSGRSHVVALLIAGASFFVLASVVDARPLRHASRGSFAGQSAGRHTSDSADVVATAERFHAALAAGDSASALKLLAPDVTILEGGAVERLADYVAHHLMADIEFARTVRSTRTLVHVVVNGDVAWVTSTSLAQGEARGRAINSQGAELMVLTKGATGWSIRSIHWSSRARRVP